jgi:hypothetical protein
MIRGRVVPMLYFVVDISAGAAKSLTRKFPGVGERPVIHRLRDGSEALIRDVDTSA